MKISLILALAAVPLLFTACATPQPPQVYRNTDNTALVIESLDNDKSQMLLPTATTAELNSQLLQKARALAPHQTAVVILDNYTEPQLGHQFRDRGTPWFISLRGIGYEHIFFLQGNGTPNPDGLLLLARYD